MKAELGELPILILRMVRSITETGFMANAEGSFTQATAGARMRMPKVKRTNATGRCFSQPKGMALQS